MDISVSNSSIVKERGVRLQNTKAMRSIKAYVGYAKTAELRRIPTSLITVINVIIPLR